jgi:hypothetical protein
MIFRVNNFFYTQQLNSAVETASNAIAQIFDPAKGTKVMSESKVDPP